MGLIGKARWAVWPVGAIALAAIALIGLGVWNSAQGSASTRASICAADRCGAQLKEALSTFKDPAAAVVQELVNRWPASLKESVLTECRDGPNGPNTCQVSDPASLPADQSALLLAMAEGEIFQNEHHLSRCGDAEGCRAQAMAAAGLYGGAPVKLRGALLRTRPAWEHSLDGPPGAALAACAADAAACTVKTLAERAPTETAMLLEADWSLSGEPGDFAAPPPSRPPLSWLAASLALGLIVGLGVGWAIQRLNSALSKSDKAAGSPDGAIMSAARDWLDKLTPEQRQSPAAQRVADALRTLELLADQLANKLAEENPALATPSISVTISSHADLTRPPAPEPRRGVSPRRPDVPASNRPAPSQTPPAPQTPAETASTAKTTPPPSRQDDVAGAVETFRGALGVKQTASAFLQSVLQEKGNLADSLPEGARTAMAAILAGHQALGDVPVRRHASAYQKLVDGLAGPDFVLIWPADGAVLDDAMETVAHGEVRSHAVEVVVRPGFAGPDGMLLRPRVLAR